MPDRHVVAIDRAGAPVAGFVRGQVGDDLVAVEIEVDPGLGRAALGTAEQPAVEGARAPAK
jgi:hypothetical protein